LQIIFSGIGFNQTYSSKSFWSKIYYGCKISSPGICMNKNFNIKYFGQKFLWLQNHFLRNSVEQKIFIKNILVKNFFVANLFP